MSEDIVVLDALLHLLASFFFTQRPLQGIIDGFLD